MPKSVTDYSAVLRGDFLTRRLRNPLYSVRAYARSLGVGKTTLAAVMSGSRHLSADNAEKVASKLGWSPRQRKAMLDQISGGTDSRIELDEDIFSLIADWQHYAILSLASLEKNKADPEWIAGRLGIEESLVGDALARLERLGYLTTKGGRLRRRIGTLTTPTDIPSEAVRKRHQQNLKLAEQALLKEGIDRRDFSSITVNIQAKNMRKAKDAIKKFRREFSDKWDTPQASDVYTLSIQFFPLTRQDPS